MKNDVENKKRQNLEYELSSKIRKMEYFLEQAKLSDFEIIDSIGYLDTMIAKYSHRIKNLMPYN